MNVLWTYHFIHGNPEIAEPIWQNFVKGSNQIMFQKVTLFNKESLCIILKFDIVLAAGVPGGQSYWGH